MVGRSKTGPCSERACRSVEIVSGPSPAAELPFEHVEGEPARAVPDVEQHPAVPGRVHGRARAARRCRWRSASRCRRAAAGPGPRRAAGGAVPMWTMTGTPQAAAAARPRRSGSTPLSPTVSRSMRTLMPRIRSRWAWIGVDGQRDVAVGQVAALPGAPGQPDRGDVEQRGHPHAAAAATRRSPARVYAPADPASTQVVTPVCQAIGSGSMPQ